MTHSDRLQAIDLGPYLLDEQVGVVHALVTEPVALGEPAFHRISAFPCNTHPMFGRGCLARVTAAGHSPSRAQDRALRRAVAAYCAAGYDARKLTLGPAAALGRPHVAPADLVLYAPPQYDLPGFPWVPFGPTTPVCWTEGTDLLTGERYLLPAALAYVPYHPPAGTGEAPIVRPSTTGLACGRSRAEAALAGLYDVIRDDALVRGWHDQLAPPHVLVETLSDANYALVRRFESTGLSVTLLRLLPESGVPVLLATLTGSSPETPCLVAAGGASLDPDECVREAMEGLAQGLWYAQQVRASGRPPWSAGEGAADVGTIADHSRFWWPQEHAPLCRPIFASRQRVEFDDLAGEPSGEAATNLAAVLRGLRAAGRLPLLIDLTTTDVLTLGLHVVRVVVPGYRALLPGVRQEGAVPHPYFVDGHLDA